MEKLLKAKKGTPEYEEWLRKYRDKRGYKPETKGIVTGKQIGRAHV